jgi:tetratricopeptide (TPR) repeat protein
MREYAAAYRYFHRLLTLTDDRRIKAVSYNAMGCIHAVASDLDKACELFRLAHETDPTLPDPLQNLSACLKSDGAVPHGPADAGGDGQGMQAPPN